MIPAARARSMPGSVWPRWTPQPSSSAASTSSLTTSSASRSPRARPSSTTCAVGAPFSRSWTTVAPPAAARAVAVGHDRVQPQPQSACVTATQARVNRTVRGRDACVQNTSLTRSTFARAVSVPGRARRARRRARRGSCPAPSPRRPRPPRRRRRRRAPRRRPRAASSLPARKQPVSAVDMQPVPVIAASSSCPFAIAACALAVGDVVDRAGDGRDDAERPRGLARELGRVAAGADRLDAAHLGLDADERRDLAGVPAQDGDVDVVEDPLRRVGPVRASRPRRPGRGRPGSRARSPPRRRAASPRSSAPRACRC